MSEPLKVFITYLHNDRQQNTQLKTRLAVMESEITLWDDNEILPGDEWYKDISTNLAASDILLYLVPATSLASKNCNKELAKALSTKIRIIPIILESCDWLNHKLSDFQALPDQGSPINNWQSESDGWQNVVDGIQRAVAKMQSSIPKETSPEWVFQQGNFPMMHEEIDRAIENYSHVIAINPNNAATYNNRGMAYGAKSEVDSLPIQPSSPSVKLAVSRAIKDYHPAIGLNPELAPAYYNRGVAWLCLREWEKAKSDLTVARDKGINIITVFRNDYESVENFERRNGVQLSEEITTMLL